MSEVRWCVVVPGRMLELVERGVFELPKAGVLMPAGRRQAVLLFSDAQELERLLRTAHAAVRGGDRRTLSCALRSLRAMIDDRQDRKEVGS